MSREYSEKSHLLQVKQDSIGFKDKCASFGTATSSCISAVTKPVWNIAKQIPYPSIDYLRIALVTQSLTGRWLWQFFLELDRYGWAPEKSVQQTWIGWPIIATAFSVAIVAKGVNYYFRKKQDLTEGESISHLFTSDATNEYEDKKGYLALQDYIYAVFSSSIVYFLLDAVSSTGNLGSIALGWFIATSVLVPVVSIVSAKTATPDTTDAVIVKPSQLNGCPAYPHASVVEKMLNGISGAVYGANIFILFWTINREIAKQTVPLETWQLLVSSLYVLATSVSGYFLTSHPKLFHGVVAASKAMRDGSLAYAALSGIGFHLLTGVTQCKTPPCWGEDIETGLTFPFALMAITVGIFSALTSLFRYDESHQSYLDNKNMVMSIPGKIKSFGSTIVGGIGSGLTSCGALFSRCSCQSSDNDPEVTLSEQDVFHI